MNKIFKIFLALSIMTTALFYVGCNKDKPVTPPAPISVTTRVSDVSSTTAKFGCSVVVRVDTIIVSEIGVCWGRKQYPTIEDDHFGNKENLSSLDSVLSNLVEGREYRVRAYAITSDGVKYGGVKTFITGPSGHHDYVDLGLPSGTLWATCNVGAEKSSEYGYFFAWGETQAKYKFNWNNYKYCRGSANSITKYYRGDGRTKLLSADDAAKANWGAGWRMPTKAEWEELKRWSTSVFETTVDNVKGKQYKCAGRSIFLPYSGCIIGTEFQEEESNGFYWTNERDASNEELGRYFVLSSSSVQKGYGSRCNGMPVRAVRDPQ